MNKVRYGVSSAVLHVRQHIVRVLDPAGVWLDYPEDAKLSTSGKEELEHILKIVPESLPLAIKELPEEPEKTKISWEIENAK